ncbi:GIP, partial [Symbiodinium sp. CCMP2456]
KVFDGSGARSDLVGRVFRVVTPRRLEANQVSPHNSFSATVVLLCLCCSLLCQIGSVAALHCADATVFSVSPPGAGAAPEPEGSFPGWLQGEQRGAWFEEPSKYLPAGWWEVDMDNGAGDAAAVAAQQAAQQQAAVTAQQAAQQQAAHQAAQQAAQQQAAVAAQQAAQAGQAGMVAMDQVDRLVRQRLEQAFNGVFGRLLSTTEKAAQAAEANAASHKTDSMMKGLKVDVFRPTTREEELRGWKEWWFGFSTYVCGHDPAYEDDFKGIDLAAEVDQSLMSDAELERSRKLYSLLCSLLKGRPLLLIKGLEGSKNGMEAIRLLRNAMEPQEKTRSLALLRQLAGWTFQAGVGLQEQIVKYEEALKMYEDAAGKEFPPDLVLATVVNGLRDPLRSQVQMRMTSRTTYAEVKEWVVQYENMNAPWSSSLQGGRGGAKRDEPQPMEVDMVKGKGKDKGKSKGKDKNGKGKGKEKGKQKGKFGDGKGWSNWHDQGAKWKQQPGSYNNNGGNGSWNTGWGTSWNGQAWTSGKDKGKSGKGKGVGAGCAICGDLRHWKNECPKGKGKGVNQVEQQSSSASSVAGTSTAASSTPSSASALRAQVQYGVNRVSTHFCGTPPGCRITEVFDISELEDEGEFSLEAPDVFMISAVGFADGFFQDTATSKEKVIEVPEGVPVFSMDHTDGDGMYTLPGETGNVFEVLAVSSGPLEVDVVIDSGADISVAPLQFRGLGCPTRRSGVIMQDAQGKQIAEVDTRILEVAVKTVAGDEVTIRERFCIAKVRSTILSLGRLLRAGWLLGDECGKPVIQQGPHKVPIRLRRNTLTVGAMISEVAVPEENDENECTKEAETPRRGINMLTFDDMGPLPPELEDVMATPGWHIVPSGLPVLVSHATEELELERSLWDVDDWAWVAIFVKLEPSKGLPTAGDVWVQAMTMETVNFEAAPKKLEEIDEELKGKHDVVMVLGVEEFPKDLLSSPRDFFKEPVTGDVAMPAGDNGGGMGDDPLIEVGAERTHEAEEPDEVEELEGVRLEQATPLKELRQLCDKLGLAKSGGKAKVLRRLRDHHEILEKQMSAEIAKKMFQEAERNPEMPKMPKLPSAAQQQLHNVTHHPFAAWCEACVLGRAKQTPHPKEDPEKPTEETRKTIKIEIDYCYTFTKQRHEVQEGEGEQGNGDARADADDGAQRPDNAQGERGPEEGVEEKIDYRDQFGLTLVAAESSTGWLLAIPVLEKGAGALKRVVEQLVRLSLQVAPGQAVLFQGDPEVSIRQVINACEACRARLGLATEKRWVPRGSHASNGQAEKAIQTIRTNALTLRSFVEARIGASIEGQRHFFPWVMRHAGYLYNRFAVNPRGSTSFELLYGRAFRSQLVPMGEQVLYYRASKHRGDVKWSKGVWLGLHERNGAHLVGSAEGIQETRSIRRLPEEQQWSAEAVLGMKGLPWSYMGQGKRKRPLYTGAAAVRLPLLPDSATLEELARAAGKAAAEAISSATPVAPPAAGPGPDGKAKANEHENRMDHKRNHNSDFEHKGKAEANKGENRMDHRRNHDSDFKHKGVVQQWTLVVVTRSLEIDQSPKEWCPPKDLVFCLIAHRECHLVLLLLLVHDDISNAELAGLDTWDDDLEATMEHEWYEAGEPEEPWWDEFGDRPPEVTDEELAMIDRRADLTELKRLMSMGVARFAKDDEDLSSHELLTTKLVRDWRKRPNWVRRSRLVAREFRTLAAWSSDMFAPSSSLAIVRTMIAYALTNNLEITTLDVKDAYLNVDQPGKVIIQVAANLFEENGVGFKTLVLDKLLPGQRVGASSWFEMAKGILQEAKMESYPKEPTVFKATDPDEKTAMILHADDGYVKMADGVAVFSNGKYLESLLKTAGPNLKRRDAPADQTFQDTDETKELDPAKAKVYKESVGRLLYLSHSRPDIQMPVCVLASRMSSPTAGAYKQLMRVIGYLAAVPDIGFMIRPVVSGARLRWPGNPNDNEEMIYEVESVTDSDWAGCKRSRRSRTSIQMYVGGGFVGSMVRSQRSVALSSAESEYLALISGACEAIFVVDVLKFLVGGSAQVRLTCRTDSAACRGICQRLGAGRVRHLHCAVLWVQQAVRNKQLQVATVSGAENPADLGTKPLPNSRVKELLWMMGCVESDGTPYGLEEFEAATQKRMMAQMLKDMKSSGAKVNNVKALLPLVLLLSQVNGVQGLGLAAVVPVVGDTDFIVTMAVAIGFGTFLAMVVYGVPWGLLKLLKWSFSLFQDQGKRGKLENTAEKGIQASRGMSKDESKFIEEYVERCNELRAVVSEQRAELEKFERVVRELRAENYDLSRRPDRMQIPPEIAVTTSRGERFHL